MKEDKHIIIKTGKSQFNLSWENVPNSELNLDFRPIQEQFKLNGVYCLVHWQAMPKGLRRWGVYDSLNDRYISIPYDHLVISNHVKSAALQIDENIIKTLPTAVFLYEKSYLRFLDPEWLIGGGKYA